MKKMHWLKGKAYRAGRKQENSCFLLIFRISVIFRGIWEKIVFFIINTDISIAFFGGGL